MGYWNYRVVYDKERDSYAIHSAYYSQAGEVVSLSIDPMAVEAESVDGLRAELERMISALDDGVLKSSDFTT